MGSPQGLAARIASSPTPRFSKNSSSLATQPSSIFFGCILPLAKPKRRVLCSIVASVDPDKEGYNLAGLRTQPGYTPKAKLRGIQQTSQTFGDSDVAFILLNE
jgi:hypothetical protein